MRAITVLFLSALMLLSACSAPPRNTGHDPYASIATALKSATNGLPVPCAPGDRATCVPNVDVRRDVVPALTAKGARCTATPLQGDNADCRLSQTGPNLLTQDVRFGPPADGRAPNSISTISVYGLATQPGVLGSQAKNAWNQAVTAAGVALSVVFAGAPLVTRALTKWISGDPNVICGIDNPRPPVTVHGYQLSCLAPSINPNLTATTWEAAIMLAAPEHD